MTPSVYAKHKKREARRLATERHRDAYWRGRTALWHNDTHNKLRAEVGQ